MEIFHVENQPTRGQWRTRRNLPKRGAKALSGGQLAFFADFSNKFLKKFTPVLEALYSAPFRTQVLVR